MKKLKTKNSVEFITSSTNGVAKIKVENQFEQPFIKLEFFEPPKTIRGGIQMPPNYVEIYGEETLKQLSEIINEGLKEYEKVGKKVKEEIFDEVIV